MRALCTAGQQQVACLLQQVPAARRHAGASDRRSDETTLVDDPSLLAIAIGVPGLACPERHAAVCITHQVHRPAQPTLASAPAAIAKARLLIHAMSPSRTSNTAKSTADRTKRYKVPSFKEAYDKGFEDGVRAAQAALREGSIGSDEGPPSLPASAPTSPDSRDGAKANLLHDQQLPSSMVLTPTDSERKTVRFRDVEPCIRMENGTLLRAASADPHPRLAPELSRPKWSPAASPCMTVAVSAQSHIV